MKLYFEGIASAYDKIRMQKLNESKNQLFLEQLGGHLDNIQNKIENGVFVGDLNLNGLGLEKLPEFLRGIKVQGSLDIGNNELVSLENCPTFVSGSFNASKNSIRSLKGGPQKVFIDYIVDDNELESVEGSYMVLKGTFSAKNNNLKSLVGGPSSVGQDYIVSFNKMLTSISGCPKTVGRNFEINNCSITSLQDSPEFVGGWYWAQNNKIKVLTGCTQKIGGNFNISHNQIKSMVNGPVDIGGEYYANNNFIVHLDGIPHRIGRGSAAIQLNNNPVKFSKGQIMNAVSKARSVTPYDGTDASLSDTYQP